MAQFRPQTPFNVPLILLVPTYTTVSGVRTKSFPEAKDGSLFYGSFRTFGGTESTVNGVYTIEDTATIETWYRSDIKSECRVVVGESGAVYEIYGEPENILMRNQFLRFKIRRIKGGA